MSGSSETKDLVQATTWEQRWVEKKTGWDMSGSSPLLVNLVRDFVHTKPDFYSEANKEHYKFSDIPIPPGGPNTKALIPGCGRGYDVQLLAERYGHAIGCDISATGVEEAKKWLSEQPATTGKRSVLLKDFFDTKTGLDADGPFDLIYDYTFLCALVPDLYDKWATRMAELLTPHGELITMIYPIVNEGVQTPCPPYPMNFDLIKSLLTPKGFHCMDSITILPPELSHPVRSGNGPWNARTGFARWRKQN